MVSFGLMLYAVVVAIVVAGVWAFGRRGEVLPLDGRAVTQLRAARRRSLVAIACALTVLAAGAATLYLQPQWLGTGAAIAPAIAGACGLTLYALTPPPQDSTEQPRYSASLHPRSAWSVTPRSALVVFGVALGALLTLLICTGLTASPDELGRSRTVSFSTDNYAASAGPYPGWFYAGPLIISALLLALATWFALHRIARTASLPGEGLDELDTLWRARTAQVVIGLATAAICLQLGGTAFFAGSAIGNAAALPGLTGAWRAVAYTLGALGAVALIASVVSLSLATLRAVALPRSRKPSEFATRSSA